MPNDETFDDTTPVSSNGHKLPSAESLRLNNIALIFESICAKYRDLGSSVDELNEIEKRSLEMSLARHLHTTRDSLDVLIAELLNGSKLS